MRICLGAEPFQKFWSNVLASPEPLLFCVGAAGHETLTNSREPEENELISITTGATVARIASTLYPQGKHYRIIAASKLTFDQLRLGPLVLVGISNNAWTKRLTDDLPFSFNMNKDSVAFEILDRQSEPHRSWGSVANQMEQSPTVSYAIVARVRNSTTRQATVVVAGLDSAGTEAASQFFSSPMQLTRLLKDAPKDWEHMNFEAVIQTQIIEGHPGAPAVLTSRYWYSQ